MASIKRTGITDKGKDLIAREVAGATDLTFTKISASNNKLADTVNLETLINLDGIKQTVNVSKIEKLGTSQVKVTATFNNSGLMNGYSMESLGIYARDAAGTEILFAVTVADKADFMPATNGINLSTATVELLFNISNTENVSLSVNTEALATAEMLNLLKNEIDKGYVKYKDTAEENKAGIVTLSSIKNMINIHAPKPDLSPYMRWDKGYKNDSNSDFVLRSNNTDCWTPRHLYMYLENGDYMGCFHLNGMRAYFKVPNRAGGGWCEIMDNHDMAVRDARMNSMDSDRANIRNLAQEAWNKGHDAQMNRILTMRLAGYYQGSPGSLEAKERQGYVVTGLIGNAPTGQLGQIHTVQMRALQFQYGNGTWFNTPHV
nr:MAG TPA: tail collar fiber protein [Caudoviricetes sp.]